MNAHAAIANGRDATAEKSAMTVVIGQLGDRAIDARLALFPHARELT
jgi:hypothetical protein